MCLLLAYYDEVLYKIHTRMHCAIMSMFLFLLCDLELFTVNINHYIPSHSKGYLICNTVFCQILLKNKFSWIKFLQSSFQPCLASVMNLKFHERKLLRLFSDPQNPRIFSTSKLYGNYGSAHAQMC